MTIYYKNILFSLSGSGYSPYSVESISEFDEKPVRRADLDQFLLQRGEVWQIGDSLICVDEGAFDGQQPHPQGDGACDSSSHFWADHNRRIDCRPELKKILTNVYRSVVIRMALVTTLFTPKLSLRRAIPALNVSALRTLLTGVAWVYKAHIHTSSFGFVGDECLELVKAPSMQPATLSLPHLGSTANIREVFKNQCCTAAYRPSQSLTQHMVTVFSETSLSARQLFQVSLGRFRAFRLQSTAQLKCSIFYSFPMVGTILAPSAIHRRGGDTQVHAYNLISCNCFRSFDIHNNVQPPSPFTVLQQVCTGVLPVQVLPIVFSDFKGQFYPSVDTENRQFRAVKPNGVRPGIVPNGTTFRGWTANRLAFLFQALSRFQSLSCFDSSGTNQLRRQASHSAMVVVGCFVQFYAICQVVFPSILTHGIKRPSVLLNRLSQHLSRFSVGLKLDANRSLHTHIIPSYRSKGICELQRLCVDFGGIEPRSIDAPIPPHPQGDAVSRSYL